MARIPNQTLINLRNTFGIDPQFLLSDLNDYTMEGPENDVIPIDDGIASVNTSLPMYIRDDNDNLFSEYSIMDGAPAYIRPIKEAKKTGIMQAAKDKGNALLDFIKGGGITGFAARALFGEEDPRASFLRDYYGGEDGSNLTSTGSIASGLMAGYNPVSGSNFLNKISGGFLPGQTFGLQNAYDRRIKAIQNTIQKKYLDKGRSLDDTKLDERLAKLREEKRKEAEALKTQFNREEQRYRDDPGAKSYSGGFDRSTNNYNDPFDPGETE